MVEITQGNLLTASAEALINTVNCVGYVGKGIALQFKRTFPDNFTEYQKACRADLVQPGKMLTFETSAMPSPRDIINFPKFPDEAALAKEVEIRGNRSRPAGSCVGGQAAWNPLGRGAAAGMWISVGPE